MTGGRRLAIIGCGAVVRSSYIKTLPRPPQARVTAVYDRDARAARLVADALGARVAGSVEDACAGADLVLVATPPGSHAEMVQRGLEAGLDVFCEKPFVPTVAEARSLLAVASSKGKSIYVGHFRRTFAVVQAARGVLRSGVLGPVLALDVREGGRFAWAAATDYFLADRFGGVLLDTGSHTLDTALYVCGADEGDVEVAVGNVERDGPEPSHELRASGELRLAGAQVPFAVAFSRRMALANRIRVTCERGMLDIPVGPLTRLRLTGPSGSTVLRTPGVADYDEAFAMQWQWLLDGARSRELRAGRFLGLTAMLEALGGASVMVAP